MASRGLVLLISPCGKSHLDLLSFVSNLAGLRLLQLRMEKEEMEEELGEKMAISQRDLEQAPAGARDTHQVEELKKVLGPGARRQVGMTPASLMHLCPG